jgi:hypothetical protein
MVMFEGIMQQRGEKLAREEKKQIKKHSMHLLARCHPMQLLWVIRVDLPAEQRTQIPTVKFKPI